MSYRIHFGIIKKSDLDNHLKKEFTNSDEDYDKKWDFFHNSTKTELNDNTPIESFKKVKRFEEEEYPPYILTKKDFQRLLDYYKVFLKESFQEKEEMLNNIHKNKDIGLREIRNLHTHFIYLNNYFGNLITQKNNIESSGLFLLDYFNLVKMYENWKNGDRGLITHG